MHSSYPSVLIFVRQSNNIIRNSCIWGTTEQNDFIFGQQPYSDVLERVFTFWICQTVFQNFVKTIISICCMNIKLFVTQFPVLLNKANLFLVISLNMLSCNVHVSLFCVTILFFPEFLKNLKILKEKNYFLSTYLKTAEHFEWQYDSDQYCILWVLFGYFWHILSVLRYFELRA